MRIRITHTLGSNYRMLSTMKLNENNIRKELDRALNRSAKRVLRDMKAGVKSWTHKCGFAIRDTSSAVKLGRFIHPVQPHLEIYYAVHNGVPARMIYPRRAKVLKYRRDYIPASTRGVIESRWRARRGGPWMFRKSVSWPGIQARMFSFYVAKREMIYFTPEINKAIAKIRFGVSY